MGVIRFVGYTIQFNNKQSLVWDMARKAVRLEMKSIVETVSSLSLESIQHTGQTLAGSHSVVIIGMGVLDLP